MAFQSMQIASDTGETTDRRNADHNLIASTANFENGKMCITSFFTFFFLLFAGTLNKGKCWCTVFSTKFKGEYFLDILDYLMFSCSVCRFLFLDISFSCSKKNF